MAFNGGYAASRLRQSWENCKIFPPAKSNKGEARKMLLLPAYENRLAHNVRPLTEAAEIGAEYFLPRYNFLGLDKRSNYSKPALA